MAQGNKSVLSGKLIGTANADPDDQLTMPMYEGETPF